MVHLSNFDAFLRFLTKWQNRQNDQIGYGFELRAEFGNIDLSTSTIRCYRIYIFILTFYEYDALRIAYK